jgi:hypothetical protein
MIKPIIVLGMHRGGTSLVGELLHAWGASAGQKELLIPADEDNRQGYWEYLPFVRFNQHLLESAGASWVVPLSREDDVLLEASSLEPIKRQEAVSLIGSMPVDKPWFWKDPRTSVLLPFWKRVWGPVTYVIAVRHPIEIAMSLRKRNRLPVSASLLLWQKYMIDTLAHTEGTASRIFMDFDELIRDPEAECQRLASFLEGEYGPSNQLESLSTMRRAVNPSQRHHRSMVQLRQAPQATAAQEDLYALLQRKTLNASEPFDHSRFPLYAGWREYLQTLAVLGQMWSLFSHKEKALLAQMSTAELQIFGL